LNLTEGIEVESNSVSVFTFENVSNQQVSDDTQLRFQIFSDEKVIFEFVCNQKYGVLVNNKHYFDVDLDFLTGMRKEGVTTEKLFVSVAKDRIFISINGLSFADVLYSGEYSGEKAILKVDKSYTSERLFEHMALVKVIKDEIPEKLAE
jgi:hypothetical protein